ncbi:MAG: hypothetical protein O7D32_00565 [bacterium]|nr:hypothetical protein [bacterium]
MNALRKIESGRTRLLILTGIVAIGFAACSDDEGDRPLAPSPPPSISVASVGGLPHNDVYDIFEDSQGRMWFATNSGVLMIDGTTSKVFDDQDSIPNRQIRAVAELNDQIWVGTWGGDGGTGGVGFADSMAIYDDDTPWDQLPIADARLPERKVSSLAVDASLDFLYIGTANGMTRYRNISTGPERDKWRSWAGPSSAMGGNGNISDLVFYNSPRGKEVWITKRNTQDDEGNIPGHVSIFRPGTGFSFLTPANSAIPSTDATAVIVDPNNDLVYATFADAGVSSVDVDGSKWTHFDSPEGLVSSFAMAIGIQADGTKWVGTMAGLTCVTPAGNITNYTAGSGLPTVQIQAIFVDSQDRVWLGFIGGGAARVTSAEGH